MGLKRKIGLNEAPNKVCLNLFFDENNLTVPNYKKNEYIAHEILQMKPLINKGQTYERFLRANQWVFKLFPNGKNKSKIQSSNVKSNPKSKVQKFCHLDFVIWISNKIESFLKNLQLNLISKHQTTEIITPTQLWFHPDDFEKKIKL